MQNNEEINRLKNLVQNLLDEAKKQGASSAEAGLSVDNGLSVNARLGEVETIEHHCDQSLGVTVYFAKKKGSASTYDLSSDSIYSFASSLIKSSLATETVIPKDSWSKGGSEFQSL